jgi:hypothetical protein
MAGIGLEGGIDLGSENKVSLGDSGSIAAQSSTGEQQFR